MAPNEIGKSVSFVVRIYRGVCTDRREWQGLVEHVQSGNQRPFHNAEDLIKVLEELSRFHEHGPKSEHKID